ncbi:MAG TPA: sigma-70 family RNA polymerase sigma factor [Acidimicrobiales bacterium]|jgi:RNA polymerase sigma-70 factor (ECF subfamily)
MRTHRPTVDEEAEVFGALFTEHAQAVYAFCARRTASLALADDLTSLVFLEAWRHRARMQLALEENPLPWLLGVANNVVRNATRAQRRNRAALAKLPEPAVSAGAEDEVISRGETVRVLREALDAISLLNEGERDVVALVLWSGLSYEQAAVSLRVPVGTIRSRLSRARSKLQTSLSSVYIPVGGLT